MAASENSEGLRIVAVLDNRFSAMPLQVQDNDKTKLEVHGSVRARFKIKNSHKIR